MNSSTTHSPNSSESWLSSKGTQLEKKHLLELWRQYNVNELAHLDLHYKYANWYSAFFIALFGGYVIGLIQYLESSFSILFLVLPSLVLVLAHLGKKALDRFYLSFLEMIVMEAKVEKLLGLDGRIKAELTSTEPYIDSIKTPWPEDKHFIPLRYVKARYDPKIKNSAEWVNRHMKLGANKITHCTFLAFQITAVLLLFGGIAGILLID